jgi:O-antigen/teichoic acid export membrane protein
LVTSEVLAESLSRQAPKTMGRQAARGVVWITFQALVVRLSGVVIFLVLARLLLPVEFGLLAAAQVFVALSRTLAEAGLSRTLVQKPTLRAAHLDSAFLVSAIIGFVLTVVMAVSAPLIANLYNLPRLTPVLLALSVVPLLVGMSNVPDAILSRQLMFRALAVRGMYSVVSAGVVGIVLAFLGAGVWALVAQVITQAMVAFVVLWTSAGWLPSRNFEAPAIRELLGFGSHVVGIALLNFFNRRAGELLIGVVLGPVALGLYAVAMRVLTLSLDLMINNVNKIAWPVFSRVAHQPERLRRAYLRSTGITTLVAFPGFTILGAFGIPLTPLLFGEQWTAAGPLMTVLAFIGPVQSIALFNNGMLLATGHSRRALGWTATLAVATFLAFAGSVKFGVLVVAIAYVGVNWLLLPVGLFLVRSVSTVTLREQVGVMLVPLGGCAVMTIGVVLFRDLTHLDPISEVLIGVPLAVSLYAATTLPFRWDLLSSGLAQLRRGRTSVGANVQS